MPSLSLYKNMFGSNVNMGQTLKSQSDLIMEETWWRDLQAKKAYIYDYYHDGEPNSCKNLNPKNDPNKTPIDIKFIVTQYGSISKDQVEYHIQFRPSHRCELDYFSEYEKKYWAEYPIGLYIDIPDEQGIYRKWMIVSHEEGNQFIKYSVLPCNFHFHWVMDGKKYAMWGIARLRNSLRNTKIVFHGAIYWKQYIEKFSNCWDTFRVLLTTT